MLFRRPDIASYAFDQMAASAILLGDELPALGDGSNRIVLCMSTCDPDRVEALAKRVVRRGIRYPALPKFRRPTVTVAARLR